jgi:NAD(P)-dependent dehydrogenase (short-subunit alcohol dehydrogenase family)
MSIHKIWFVTGASKGMGLTLVRKLLEQGYKVAATSRTKADLVKAVGSHERFLAINLDLTDEKDVQQAISTTIEHFGGLDVVVNNAGYGQLGFIEEVSDELVRKNFETNVFGTLNVVRQALPQLRKQRSGHIINFSSVGGFYGFAGGGIYGATKFAVDGMSEALSQEVRPFGIHVTSIKPGYFRTNFLSEGSISGTTTNLIDDYKVMRDEQEALLRDFDKNQPGDPEKAMDVLIKVTESEHPPVHLFLGQDAYDVANNKITNLQKDLTEWETLGTSTDFM